ncbi:MAG: hypothetical protein EBQ76_04535 [Betaproteobacteria bacterium]|nr:hypothetical protein [Betaproteobacteria bacterium]NBY14001.1 hypothetical protein [Betaproteobacteria bacterium]NDF04323.1 hypothetical protein [Betaproteobacteria bacterium]
MVDRVLRLFFTVAACQLASGCSAVMLAADVATSATSAAVGATTTVVGGAIDVVSPSSSDKKK